MSDTTYEEWLAKLAAECRCCAGCTSLPCGGCAAGALCDEMCHCGDRDESWRGEDFNGLDEASE